MLSRSGSRLRGGHRESDLVPEAPPTSAVSAWGRGGGSIHQTGAGPPFPATGSRLGAGGSLPSRAHLGGAASASSRPTAPPGGSGRSLPAGRQAGQWDGPTQASGGGTDGEEEEEGRTERKRKCPRRSLPCRALSRHRTRAPGRTRSRTRDWSQSRGPIQSIHMWLHPPTDRWGPGEEQGTATVGAQVGPRSLASSADLELWGTAGHDLQGQMERREVSCSLCPVSEARSVLGMGTWMNKTEALPRYPHSPPNPGKRGHVPRELEWAACPERRLEAAQVRSERAFGAPGGRARGGMEGAGPGQRPDVSVQRDRHVCPGRRAADAGGEMAKIREGLTGAHSVPSLPSECPSPPCRTSRPARTG